MALPPLELFSLKEKAAPLPGGLFSFSGANFASVPCALISSTRDPKKLSKQQCDVMTSSSLMNEDQALECGCVALRESARTIKFIEQADVAQLVEQPIRNRQVTGSSPVVGSRDCSPTFPFKVLVEPDSYPFIHGIFKLATCLYRVSVR
jgi:hypothetical protein